MQTRFRFGINTKVLLALLAVSLLPLIAFVVLFEFRMNALGGDLERRLREQAKDDLQQLTRDQAAITTAIFDTVAAETHLMAQFASNLWDNPDRYSHSSPEEPADVSSASAYTLAPGVSRDAVKADINLSSRMIDVFRALDIADSNVHLVYLGTASGVFRPYPPEKFYDAIKERSYDPRTRPWYREAVQQGKTVWTHYSSFSRNEYIFTCSSPVYTSEGVPVGVVAADITLETISSKIIKTPEEIPGYAFLVSKEGKVIAQEPGLEPLLKIQEETGILEEMANQRKGITLDTSKRYYVAYASSSSRLPGSSQGWSLGIVMSVDDILAPAKAVRHAIGHVRYILVAILVAMIFAVSSIAYGLSRRITKPIRDLSHDAGLIGSGNLDHVVKVQTGDEIGDLADALNQMTRDLKVYAEELQAVTAARERVASELKIATEIQASMLPRVFPPFPDRAEFEIFATMDPAKEVGGDFYDFFFMDDKHLCFLIADVSDKGVPAALFMMVSKTLLKTEAMRGLPPEEVLFRVNNLLYPDNKSFMFVTVFSAVLDIETGEVCFATAGHNPPLLKQDGKVDFLALPESLVLGVSPDTPYTSKTIQLKDGDMLFLYTDGVTEAKNPSHELFGEKRLKQFCEGRTGANVTEIIRDLRTELEVFSSDAPQFDDITMLALKFNKRQYRSGSQEKVTSPSLHRSESMEMLGEDRKKA